jgi:O-antigen/teichoic acid export membrane protein
MALVGAGAFYRGVGAVFRVVTVLGTTVLLVRLLDPASYGLVALGFAAVGIASVLTTLGLGPATTRTLAAHVAAGEEEALAEVVNGLKAWVVLGALVGLVALVALVEVTQPQLTFAQGLITGVGLGTMLLGRNAAIATEALARGFGRMTLMELPNVLGSVVQLSLIIVLFAFDVDDIVTVAVALGAAGAVTVGISMIVAARIWEPEARQPRGYRSSAIRLARLAAPYALAGVAGVIALNLDILFLGLFGSDEEVAAFEPVVRVVGRVLSLIPLLLGTAFIVAATTLITQRHDEDFERLYLTVSKLSFVLTFPAVILIAIAPTVILRTLFGTEFPVSVEVVWLVLAAGSLDLAFGLNRGALVATGARRALVRASSVTLVTATILALALIAWFGAEGAAVAILASTLVLNLSMSWALYRSSGVHPFHRELVLVIVTAPLALGMAAFGAHALFDHESLWAVLLATGVSWAVWVLFLRVFSVLHATDALALFDRGVTQGDDASEDPTAG